MKEDTKVLVCSDVHDELQWTFEVYKEYRNGEYEISVIQNDGRTRTTLKTIRYLDVGEEYESPYLSWYNLIFCSNEYGVPPFCQYMNYSVQNGKKLVATVDIPAETIKEFYSQIPETCGYEISSPDRSKALIYRKGRLSDFFDCDKVTELYVKHGVFPNKLNMQKMFEIPISELVSGAGAGLNFLLQHEAGDAERMAITGLLLGYPLESTVALLK